MKLSGPDDSDYGYGKTRRHGFVSMGIDAVYLSCYAGVAGWAALERPSWLPAWAGYAIALWAVVETTFFYLCRKRYARMNGHLPMDTLQGKSLEVTLNRFREVRGFMDMDDFVRGWFLNADIDEIHRGNLGTFVAYGCLGKDPWELTRSDCHLISRFCDEIMEKKLKPGRNDRLRFMAHLREPLHIYHKPLACYLGAEAAAAGCGLLLSLSGYSKRRAGQSVYWHLPAGRGRSASGVRLGGVQLVKRAARSLSFGFAGVAAGGAAKGDRRRGSRGDVGGVEARLREVARRLEARSEAEAARLARARARANAAEPEAARAGDPAGARGEPAGAPLDGNASPVARSLSPLGSATRASSEWSWLGLPGVRDGPSRDEASSRPVATEPRGGGDPGAAAGGRRHRPAHDSASSAALADGAAACAAPGTLAPAAPTASAEPGTAEEAEAQRRGGGLGARGAPRTGGDGAEPTGWALEDASDGYATASTVVSSPSTSRFTSSADSGGALSPAASGQRTPAPPAPPAAPRSTAPPRHLTPAAVANAALDGVLTATAAAAAAVSAQYPIRSHEGAAGAPAGRAPATRRAAGAGPPPAARRSPAPPASDSPLSPRDSVASFTLQAVHPVAGSPSEELCAELEVAAPLLAELRAASPGSASCAASVAVGARERSDAVPILFVHGVGCGLIPYLHFLRSLSAALPDHPVLAVEIPHVALRWTPDGAREVDHIVADMVTVVRDAGFSRACIVSHSYGTFCTSRFVQLHPHLVHSIAVIDPVCMMTCHPQLLHNFIYRSPSLDNFRSLPGFLDLGRYVVSRDASISQAFCRLFDWRKLQLWPDSVPARTLIVLSGKDDLVPAEVIYRQFEAAKSTAKVLLHPELGHGGYLLSMAFQREVIDSIVELLL